MSVVNVERTSRCVGQQGHTIELPTSIQEKLNTVIRKSWQAELMHRVSVAAAVGLLAVIGLVVADVLVGLRSAPLRWAIWVAGLGITVGAIRSCLVKPWRRNELLLDAAWKIESSHLAMEERLTSTVQFLNQDSRTNTSPQLIDALVNETSEGVRCIDAESIPNRSSRIPITVAALLATTLVFSVALWPQSVLTSLTNLAAPWSPYAVPTLSANISPGDVTIAEGESLNIKVIAAAPMDHPSLEIIRDDVVESHLMVATSPEVSMFTLADVNQDAVYRIHSGGLYSVPHTITVHPQPQLTAISAQLEFPDYTHLEPLRIEQQLGPIEVPAGTEVTLTAMSDDVAVDGVIQWNSEPHEVIARKVTDKGSVDSARFEWKFIIAPGTNLVGTLEVRSEHGVCSVPHPIEIRALDDSSPKVEITAPALQQLSMSRDNDLPIRYRVIDDFGVSKTELMVQFGGQEPVALSRPEPEEQPGEQRVWIGATTLELTNVPADCQEVSLWLRIADNRPDEFGGAQVIESEEIHITLDDNADSLGRQQILADRQMIEQSLEQAIEQMQEALKAAEALQNDPGETGEPDQGVEQDQLLVANDLGLNPGRPKSSMDHIDGLRRETSKAKQTLDQLVRKLQDDSNLFHPKAAEIEQVTDQEVTEALELANQIPLADDRRQQEELARGSQEQLASAIEQLDQLKSDIEQRAEQMKKAAKLDQLASKQDRLARKAAEGEQDSAPEQEWRDRQEEVADDLQSLVEETEDGLQNTAKQEGDQGEQVRGQDRHDDQQARQKQLAGNEAEGDDLKAADQPQLDPQDQEQLLEQADQAEQLAERAQQLAQQQQQLEQAMREAQQNEGKPEDAQRQLQDLIEAQKDEVDQRATQEGQRQGGQVKPTEHEAKEEQQRLKEAAKAAQEGDLDQAAAKIQEQIAERAEKIQQQTEQLARHDNSEPAVRERAKQAAEQLQQAQKKAEQAKQSLCEKCNGGGQDKPGDQETTGTQNPKPNGPKQGAKPQDQNPQQKQQGAAQPNDAGQQEQAPKQDAAKINREQQDAARSLQEAAQSLNQVCKSCRECANCNDPESSGGSQSGNSKISGSTKSGPPSVSKQLAKASDDANQSAQSPTNEKAAQNAESVAMQLNQLADDAARKSGYSLRQQKSSPTEQGKQQGADNKPDNNARSGQPGKPSADPNGVGNATGDSSINKQELRGEASSNWTRSRRELDGGVLDDREGNVPEQYRGVVKRYFEELSRQQSSRE